MVHKTNSFIEVIIMFMLIAGLADADIIPDILSKIDMDLEETVKAVEGKEYGKVAKMKVGAQDIKISLVRTHLPRKHVAEIAIEFMVQRKRKSLSSLGYKM